jgi:hypothetical protein
VNLRAAQKELGGRPPRVTAPALFVEAVVIVSVGVFLVSIFA